MAEAAPFAPSIESAAPAVYAANELHFKLLEGQGWKLRLGAGVLPGRPHVYVAERYGRRLYGSTVRELLLEVGRHGA